MLQVYNPLQPNSWDRCVLPSAAFWTNRGLLTTRCLPFSLSLYTCIIFIAHTAHAYSSTVCSGAYRVQQCPQLIECSSICIDIYLYHRSLLLYCTNCTCCVHSRSTGPLITSACSVDVTMLLRKPHLRRR